MTAEKAASGQAATAHAAADQKLTALREEMQKAAGGTGVDAYIVPTEDPHMSEYPPDCDARREFISNFTGSAGTAVVTKDKALLWTDGRYFLQAEEQLGPGWTLMRGGTPSCPEIPDWLADNLGDGGRVGIDPFLHTVDGARKLQKTLDDAGGVLVPLLEGNLVDRVWGTDRPARPDAPIRIHPLQYAGESVADKLKRMRLKMTEVKAGMLLVTALDEVAWLLNLRGADVSHNPVFIAYATITADAATLYVDKKKVSQEVQKHLQEGGVTLKDYSAMLGDVKQAAASGNKIWADPSKVSFAITTAAIEAAKAAAGGSRGKGSPRKRPRTENGAASSPSAANDAAVAKKLFVEQPSPITAAKAIKNQAELAGMVEAHMRDAVALAKFFSFIESQVAAGKSFTEVEVDEELTKRRAEQEGFIEASFPTIAGEGPNGAIIHYRAQPGTCRTVGKDSLLLLDSGGQYECGTTDITRTMHFGQPSDHQRECFTRVLQGHIALDEAVFPETTPGLALDTLARMHLWRIGLNYRHGTGHGVGAALNVHEGPMSISTRTYITTPLEAGMIVSNEPGYYEDKAFGIRVENLLHIIEANTPFRYGGQSYFGFERLTFVPIQRKMIKLEVLSQPEVDWVDSYHKEVWEKVSPRLQDDQQALQWLKTNTAPLKG